MPSAWIRDERQTCLPLEGQVTITAEGADPENSGSGGLVVFAEGLSCPWEVAAPVRMCRRFG